MFGLEDELQSRLTSLESKIEVFNAKLIEAKLKINISLYEKDLIDDIISIYKKHFKLK